MDSIIFFLLGILVLIVLVVALAKPLKLLLRLILSGILGAVMLFVINLIGASFGFHIGINAITAFITGLFGIPGVIFLVVFKMFL